MHNYHFYAIFWKPPDPKIMEHAHRTDSTPWLVRSQPRALYGRGFQYLVETLGFH